MRPIKDTRIGIIGLGYVGLPLAVEFGKHYPTVGFDIKKDRIAELESGTDSTLEATTEELRAAKHLEYSTDRKALAACNTFIVTVPTPVGKNNRPVLTPLKGASETVGSVLKKGDVVVYESTVYPGCTEEYCVPILEQQSGLKFNKDFFAGYSPERINPGDKQHRLPTIKKITSGSTPEIADYVDALYRTIITAGTHKASSLKVAEAAKVIENTQRDINIALINELSMIFLRLGIDTEEVLKAAGTKWNFLNFKPGLVGGHCIGVDPYYLTHKAEEVGYRPEIILAGRRLNDSMAEHVAMRVVKLMITPQHPTVRRTRPRAGAHLQGELPRRPQHQGCRRRTGAAELRLQSRRPRPLGKRGGSGARVRHLVDRSAEGRKLRRDRGRCCSQGIRRARGQWHS